MSTTTAPTVPKWRTHAACRGTDPALFYDPHPASVAAAKTVCDVCPVRNACRAHAVDTAEPFGVWGGLAADERPTETSPPTELIDEAIAATDSPAIEAAEAPPATTAPASPTRPRPARSQQVLTAVVLVLIVASFVILAIEIASQ